MMANSPLSLMQLQHKSEDPNGLTFSDFVNSVNEQCPLTTAMAVNKAISNPIHVGGSGGPIKRKRGRPRKYTIGPFPSSSSLKMNNSSNQSPTDRSRLSLQTQFGGNGETFSTSSVFSSTSLPSAHHTTVTDSFMKSMKQVKTKMSPKMSYPSMVPMSTTNGHSSIIEKNGGLDQQATIPATTLNPLPALPQLDAHSSDSNISSSIFRYPATPALPVSSTHEHTSFSTKAFSHIQAHQSHNITNICAPVRNSLPSNSNTSLPYFIDPFFQQTAAVTAPITTVVSTNNSGNFETNLVGRLLPQAEAAICAAKAAGLSGPHTWTPEMVAAFILTLPGCQGLAQTFIEHEIDGPALLCLEQHDLMSIMKLKLGPAVKVFGAIRVLRKTMMSIPYTDLSADLALALAAAITCFPPTSSSGINKTNNKQHLGQSPLKTQHQHPASPHLTKKLANQVPSSLAAVSSISTGLNLTSSSTVSPYNTSPSSPHPTLVNGGAEGQSIKSID